VEEAIEKAKEAIEVYIESLQARGPLKGRSLKAYSLKMAGHGLK
jgi:predicted RNase H-like HicB family nuclease